MPIQLKPYQREGVDWLKEKRFALLADDMGLGKTPQAIVAAEELGLKRILVVCPAAVRFSWVDAFNRFSGYVAEIVSSKPLATGMPDVAVVSWDWASRHGGFPMAHRDVLILDESHFGKNPHAQRTAGVFKASWQEQVEGSDPVVRHGLAAKSRRVWALSGTPAPNHPGELWVLLYCFGVTKFSYSGFTNHFCCKNTLADGTNVMTVRRSTINDLRSMLKPIKLRRLKKDVLKDLPPVDIQEVPVEAAPDDALLLREIEEKAAGDISHLSAMLKADPVNAARTLETHIGHLGSLRRIVGIAKAKPACDIIEDALENGAINKVIVFCLHRDVVSRVLTRLSRFGAVAIVGSTPPGERRLAVERFQTGPSIRVFIGNIIAAGTGLTLTAAQDVFMIEQDWVPGNNRQAIDRAHRIGQLGSVTARFVYLTGSIDDQIAKILARKARDFDAVFN